MGLPLIHPPRCSLVPVHACGLLCRYDYESDLRGEAVYSEHLENVFRHDDEFMARLKEQE